ncbi:MAG: metallophosphoesterase [Candidatus Aenigmatarchaeota archaeon]
MTLNFVAGEPALLLEPEKILVVADLHIGLERELARKGVHVPDQLLKLQERLFKIIDGTGAKQVIILGDVKNEYVGTTWGDLTDVPAFFSRLIEKVAVIVVKGNHDGGIETVVPKGVEIHEPEGFALGEYLFTHGQAWPKKGDLSAKVLVMGHIHPAVEFWSSGARSLEPAWVRAPVDKKVLEKKFRCEVNLENAIIVPAFNHLAGGAAFNAAGFKPIGPLLSNCVNYKKGDVFLLDGTYLGKLGGLVKKG